MFAHGTPLKGVFSPISSLSLSDNVEPMKRSTRNRTAGAAKEMKGRAKKAMGEMTRSGRLKAEGRMDKARGKLQKTVGKVQQSLEEDSDESEL